MGIGLLGGELSVVDPAAPAGLEIPSVAFSFQSSWADTDEDGTPGDFSGTRFPFIALGYPTRIGTVTLSFGGLLDQRWTASSSQIIDLDGEGTRGRVTDEFISDGGVSSVRLGVARRLADRVDVGIQVGRNIGDVSRVFTRRFDSLDIGGSLPSFTAGGRWSYRGWTASAGAATDVGSVLHVSAAYTWSGNLDALPDESTLGGEATFGLPSEFRAGATAILSPRLRASFGVHRASWSAADADVAEGGARDTFSWGGGVEWAGASLLGKTSALRFGYRASELPFTSLEATDPTESALVGGLGMDLLTSGEVLLARLDFALERGLREAGLFEERFWRFSTSVRVSGF
jgi:opacity protein-like surface antigen